LKLSDSLLLNFYKIANEYAIICVLFNGISKLIIIFKR